MLRITLQLRYVCFSILGSLHVRHVSAPWRTAMRPSCVQSSESQTGTTRMATRFWSRAQHEPAQLGQSHARATLPLSALEGLWENENAETQDIVRVKLELRDQGLYVTAWGRCKPVLCSWGSQLADTTRWSHGIIATTWKQSFATRTQTLTYLGSARLRVSTLTHYTYHSGRQDHEIVNYFHKR